MNENQHKVRDALKRDWEQTKHDVPGLHGEDLHQKMEDTIRQAVKGDDDGPRRDPLAGRRAVAADAVRFGDPSTPR